MAISDSDLVLYCSASMPEDDTSTSGGAIDVAARSVFTGGGQMAANDTIEALSDGADTRTVTVTARDAGGTIVSEAKALTGATPISFSTLGTVERILKVVIGATDSSRTVTIRRATGAITVGTIGPDEDTFRLCFYDSSSEAAQTIRYEKLFWKNTHASLDLNFATVQLSADPSGKIEHGVCAAKDDSTSVSNREEAPGGVVFVDDAVDQDVPGNVLESGVAIGVWAKLTLTASNAPVRSTFTFRLAGSSV